MLAHGATQVSVRRQRGVRDDLPHNPQDSGAPCGSEQYCTRGPSGQMRRPVRSGNGLAGLKCMVHPK